MFYAASTNGFYASEIHGRNIPGDAIQITDKQHAALLEGQSQGMVIAPGENGLPVLQDAPEGGISPPGVVTRRQALLALLAADLLDDVEAIIAASPKAVQIAWEASSVFQRDNPLIAGIAPQLGLSDAEIDALFVQAAAL